MRRRGTHLIERMERDERPGCGMLRRPGHGRGGGAPGGLRRGAGGFTLIELLVVTIILTLLIGIAVPAYNALILATSESRATNSLRVALDQARALASGSSGRADAAAVFHFDPDAGFSIITCVEAGSLRDGVEADDNDTDDFVERDVFAPVATLQPTQLPAGWTIRGLALAGTLSDGDADTVADNGWYDDGEGGESPNYEAEEAANWIFPESGFFDPDDENDAGAHRQTFMVRFQGGTGAALSASGPAASVLLPSPSIEFRTQKPYSNYRVDRATDLARYVERVLGAPPPGGGKQDVDAPQLGMNARRTLLGDRSIDTTLARPIGELAVFNEELMAADVGARGLNRETGSLYLPFDKAQSGGPEIDASLFDALSDPKEITARVNQWIMGTFTPEGSLDPVPTRARIFRVPTAGGPLAELTGN